MSYLQPDQPKHILILTADAGFGHRSAANAVAASLEELHKDQCQIDIVDPQDDLPFLIRESQNNYDRIIRELPKVYHFGYDASDANVPNLIVQNALTVSLYDAMSNLLKRYKPDAILVTFPIYQSPLISNFIVKRTYIPLLTVITDLTKVHRLWFNKNIDCCLVPTQEAYDLALEYGLSKDKVLITGIPVHPNIVREKRNKQEMRAKLGWRTDLPTILVVGSRRVEGLINTIRKLNEFNQPLQFAVVAGGDDQIYRQAKEIDWHSPAFIYDYVTNMPDLMHASDAIVSKAGGLITTEALACGLPIMIIDVLPGQEIGNAEFVVQGGAADRVSDPNNALEVLTNWMANDCALLKERAFNSARLGKPMAAYQIAELVWEAAESGPIRKRRITIPGRAFLVKLLKQNKILT